MLYTNRLRLHIDNNIEFNFKPLNNLIMTTTKKTTNRFIISKSLIGKNTIITFKNNKGDDCTYNHDKVYNTLKDRFEAMECFQKYKSYTNSNNLPKFVREIEFA